MKNTKRALLLSVLSLTVCFAMLIGSTFAWFTDTATTEVNTIQAGNLDIALEMYDEATKKWVNAEGKTLDFKKAVGAPATEEILWEPGCTYQLPDLRIVNNGDLHLKYIISITGIDGDAKLNEAIEWTYGNYTVGAEYVALAPKATSETITIKGHMKEEAGNEYQGLSIDGIAITVFATQLNVENDSFGPDYDKDAPTLIMIGDTKYETLAAAVEAANSGDTIKLAGDFTLPSIRNKTLTFTTTDADNKAVIAIANNTNASGSTLTFDGVTVKGHTGADTWHTTQLHGGAIKATYTNCTIIDLITTYCPSDFIGCVFENHSTADADWYSVFDYGTSEVNITNCIFNTTASKAVKLFSEGAQSATLNITGCEFNGSFFDKAAVEIDSAATTGYIVNINNCTTNEYYTDLWSDKADNSVVTVNGKREIKIANGLYYDGVSVYTVTSAEGMFSFAAQVNESGNSFSGKTVVLSTDIDLENKAWTPIGQTGDTQFGGTFDGNGKTISNLNIDTSDKLGSANSEYSTGLFGWLNAGTVKNLTIDGATIKAVRRAAAIAGYLELGATVDGCTVKNATIKCLHMGESSDNNDCGDKAGAVVGYMNSDTAVNNCKAENCSIIAGRDAGQIVGAGHTAKVTDCSATNVTVASDGSACKSGNLNADIIGRKLS